VVHLGEAAVEDRAVELRLRAVEVAGGTAGDAGFLADLAQAGRVVALLGEEPFSGIHDGLAGASRIAFAVGSRHAGSPMLWERRLCFVLCQDLLVVQQVSVSDQLSASPSYLDGIAANYFAA